MASPILARPVQDGAQLLEEEAHGLGVVVALAQRVVGVAQGVEGDREGDPGRQLLLGLRVLLADRAPGPPPVVGPIEPALVDVEDDLVLDVMPQEGLRPALALVDVEGRVHVQGLFPDPAVPHPEVVLEYGSDKALR